MKTNKKELTVFALCAYAIPFLMMPLLYICLQNGRDTSILPTPRCSTRRRALCWRSCWQDGRNAKAVLHPAHRGHCADARHERSVCVPAAGGLAEYCKLCHHYRVGAGLDLPADREKDKARRLRSAPARQIPDGVCHLCLLPRRQNRHGLSFRGAAGRRRLGGVPDLLAIVCAVAHGTGAGAKLFLSFLPFLARNTDGATT